MEKTTYEISDRVIVNIVQLLQLAMMTGQDITDQMKQIRLVEGVQAGKLELCPVYAKQHNERIEDLLAESERMSKEIAEKEKNQPGFEQ